MTVELDSRPPSEGTVRYAKMRGALELITESCERWGAGHYELLAASRKPCVVRARREIIHRLVDSGRYSLAEVGRILNIDQSSVYYALKRRGKQ